jgi:hypothetical protein
MSVDRRDVPHLGGVTPTRSATAAGHVTCPELRRRPKEPSSLELEHEAKTRVLNGHGHDLPPTPARRAESVPPHPGPAARRDDRDGQYLRRPPRRRPELSGTIWVHSLPRSGWRRTASPIAARCSTNWPPPRFPCWSGRGRPTTPTSDHCRRGSRRSPLQRGGRSSVGRAFRSPRSDPDPGGVGGHQPEVSQATASPSAVSA